MKLSLQSQLTLFPLNIRCDKKHYIVEEPLSGEFFEMPSVCIDAINLIYQGESLEKIEQELIQQYPDEEVDVLAFVQDLYNLGLVKAIDGETVTITKKSHSPNGFTWIPAKAGHFFFNKLTAKIFIVIIAVNIFIAITNPNLLPDYNDLFLFDAMMLNILLYIGVSLLFIIVHEFGHILAIRAHDLPAKMDVGNRLIFIVFETDLTPAWKLPPKKRNTLYLAGICFDQVVLFIAFSVKLFLPEMNALVTGIAGLVILDLFIKLIYQCCFYMKTDLYYLFENVTGCYNLMENGRQYLRKWLPFIKQDTSTETFEGEMKFVRMYSVFYVCGFLLTGILVVFYFIPQAFYAFSQTLPALLHPVGNPYFWDAVVFLGQSIMLAGLLVYARMKEN